MLKVNQFEKRLIVDIKLRLTLILKNKDLII